MAHAKNGTNLDPLERAVQRLCHREGRGISKARYQALTGQSASWSRQDKYGGWNAVIRRCGFATSHGGRGRRLSLEEIEARIEEVSAICVEFQRPISMSEYFRKTRKYPEWCRYANLSWYEVLARAGWPKDAKNREASRSPRRANGPDDPTWTTRPCQNRPQCQGVTRQYPLRRFCPSCDPTKLAEPWTPVGIGGHP